MTKTVEGLEKKVQKKKKKKNLKPSKTKQSKIDKRTGSLKFDKCENIKIHDTTKTKHSTNDFKFFFFHLIVLSKSFLLFQLEQHLLHHFADCKVFRFLEML